MNALRLGVMSMRERDAAPLCRACHLLSSRHNDDDVDAEALSTAQFASPNDCLTCNDASDASSLPELDARRRFWYADEDAGTQSEQDDDDNEKVDDKVSSADAENTISSSSKDEQDQGKKTTTAAAATTASAKQGKDTMDKKKQQPQQRRGGLLSRLATWGKGKNATAKNEDAAAAHEEQEEEEDEDPNPPAALTMKLSPAAVAVATADDAEDSPVLHASDRDDVPSIIKITAIDGDRDGRSFFEAGTAAPGLFRSLGYLAPPLAPGLLAGALGREDSPFLSARS